jgi:hypothetical protein
VQPAPEPAVPVVSAPKQPEPEPIRQTEPAPRVQPAQPEPEPAPRGAVRWPALKLTGVLGQGRSGSAIINDQVLAVNETIKGVRLAAVGRQGVELEYQGERRFVKVGTSTP